MMRTWARCDPVAEVCDTANSLPELDKPTLMIRTAVLVKIMGQDGSI